MEPSKENIPFSCVWRLIQIDKASLFTKQTFSFLHGLTDCLQLSNWVIWFLSTTQTSFGAEFSSCTSSRLCFSAWGLFHSSALPSFGLSVLGVFSYSWTCFFCLPFRKSPVTKRWLLLCFVWLLRRGQLVLKALTAHEFILHWAFQKILVALNKQPQSDVPGCLTKLLHVHLLTHTQCGVLSVKLSISNPNPDDI